MTAAFPERLLDQADLLLAADPRRPRQANLRRAVSAAYYALFHFLIDQSCRSVFGAAAGRAPLRNILARGFDHGTMKDVSRSFAGGSLPDWMRSVAPHLTIPDDLKLVARRFVLLQEARHRADYDLSDGFTRDEAVGLVADARDAITRWPGVADDDATRLYLAGLLCWRTLRQR
jgi:hypothetical protein